jgi:RHH-type transcriptional regulator, rel operon repressor / antitoxin RelB
MPVTPTISLRLPKDARERLDKVAAKSRRSRSFIIQEALERHLDEIEREQLREPQKGRLSTILGLAGAGTALNGPRSKEEIDAHIRWLRGDD